MKVIIDGRAFFPASGVSDKDDDTSEVQVELRGPPDDDLERWAVLIVHPRVSIELCREELQRALKAFEPLDRESR